MKKNMLIAFLLGVASTLSLGALSNSLTSQLLGKWDTEIDMAQRYQFWFGDPSYGGNEAIYWYYQGQIDKIRQHQFQVIYATENGTLGWQ